jgi:hypothetical protein
MKVTEELWDAFEKVECLAAEVAFGSGYVPVPTRRALAIAVKQYRIIRDRAEALSNAGGASR